MKPLYRYIVEQTHPASNKVTEELHFYTLTQVIDYMAEHPHFHFKIHRKDLETGKTYINMYVSEEVK